MVISMCPYYSLKNNMAFTIVNSLPYYLFVAKLCGALKSEMLFFLLHFQSRIVSHIFGGFYPACSICCLHHTFGPPSHPSIEKSYLFLWYSNLVAFTAIPFYLVGEIIYNLYSVGHFSLPNIQKSETILKNTPKNYCKTIY